MEQLIEIFENANKVFLDEEKELILSGIIPECRQGRENKKQPRHIVSGKVSCYR